MLKTGKFIFFILLFFLSERGFSGNINSDTTEIIFYTTRATFAPVIVLQGAADVMWTWADSTTSVSTTPIKNYGSDQLRANRLKVTPWSALRRINIGYDAEDGGDTNIEFVDNQFVEAVKNLHVVAPYLREWCSSYNRITSLDFTDFINLEVIECYNSVYLDTVILANNSKLKRICFEDNKLNSLDVSGCVVLEDLRGALNNFTTINFSNSTDELWHICVRDNPQITNKNLFNDLSVFPNISELFIWNANQEGSLVIPSTSLTIPPQILAANNYYTFADFSGALMLTEPAYGTIDLSYNKLDSINLQGCTQLLYLFLSHNNLSSNEVDRVLQQLDANGREGGTADLTFNRPPSTTGLVHKTNLETKGWVVKVDSSVPTGKPKTMFNNIKLYPNPAKERLTLLLENWGSEKTKILLLDIAGKELYSISCPNGCNPKVELDMDEFPAGLYIIKVTTPHKSNTYKFYHI
jgi:hypothetical protein